MKEMIWKPKPTHVHNANVTHFMKSHEIVDVHELMQRATTGIEWFWDASVHETQIDWFEPYTQLLDASEGFLKTRWFLGGRTNLFLNLLERHAHNVKTSVQPALYFVPASGQPCMVAYVDLMNLCQRVASSLAKCSLGKGDLIGLHLPATPFAVAVLLAIWKLGAIALPLSQNISREEAQTRCQTLGAKFLVTPDFEKGLDEVADQTATEELPAEYPALVLDTPGTEGAPKPVVHTHAGILAQVTKEFWFHWDFKRGDVAVWLAPFGTLMSLWQIVGTLHFCGTAVLFEDISAIKSPDTLFDVCQNAGVTHLGMPVQKVRWCAAHQKKLPQEFGLKKLRVLSAGGEPWDEASYRWYFETLGNRQLPVITLAPTTEFMGSLLAPLIIREIQPLSLQGPALGIAAGIFAEQGYPLEPGQPGVLVCRKPVPSLCKGLWKDHPRFMETYFSDFPHVWSQRDWALCDPEGSWFLTGRGADTVLLSGRRLHQHDLDCLLFNDASLQESRVVIENKGGKEFVDCSVVLRRGLGPTRFLRSQIQKRVLTPYAKQKPVCQVTFVNALS